MIILNFSHPLTAEQQNQVEALTGQAITRVIDAPVQVDQDRPLGKQMVETATGLGLSSQDWQTLPMVVSLPGYAPAAAAMLAELHGRMGHFPAVLWIRPVKGETPPRFEAAEVINLQAIREEARQRR